MRSRSCPRPGEMQAKKPSTDLRLLSIIYRELRQIAGRVTTAERADHTLQATAMVNDASLRVVDARQVRWREREHFFGIWARAVRQILVDHAHTRASAKRGVWDPA